jgi:hypothetical protein
MDKKALQNFALFAKDSLETQIKVSLKLVGIHSDKDIKKAYIQGDFTIIDGDSKTYPSDLKVKRDHILELIKTDGYAYTIEQFAYTWFNRLIALRFMEVHDYLPHGFKVFPKGNGSIEPEILSKLTLVEKELNLDIELCRQFKEKAQIEELYRYVLFQQCNALSSVLPMLFSKEYAYLELMLPSTLLKGATVITELIKIDESNFLDDVEVIGWLYQFYVSSDREEFRKAKLVNKDLIPTLTQIFTPDWIVRYMTENSLGRLWLESYPDSSVKQEFKYYVEDAEQTEEVKNQIESIRYKNVDPKDIKVIEPCSGSGHILVYAFDVLRLMYEEKGYSKNDIPKLILDNNLFGLDVDKRASQLASFSLIMKARSIDSRFFQPNRISYPKVFEIKDSKMLISMDYKKKLLDLNSSDWKKDEHLSDEELKVIDYVIETFVDGKVIGSLLKVKRDNYVPLITKMNHLHKVTIRGIFNGEFVEYGLKRIVQLLRLAEVMSRKYDVMITNPPYLGISTLESSPKEYLSGTYPSSKSDMFAMFMENTLINNKGYRALVNPDSWMFLVSFEILRKSIIVNKSLYSMIHIGMGAFDSVVQTTAFVIREVKINHYISIFLKPFISQLNIVNNLEKIESYQAETSRFIKIPSYIFGYWISQKMLSIFSDNPLLGDILPVKKGLDTGNNDYFLKLWYEVDFTKIGINCKNTTDFSSKKYKWAPHDKGGEFRRYYGNKYWVINYENNGDELKNSLANLRSKNLYFSEAITWSSLSSGKISFRHSDYGAISNTAGSSIYPSKNDILFYLGLLNSNVVQKLVDIVSPTLNYSAGSIAQIPVIYQQNSIVNKIVKEQVDIQKYYWDSKELSWDFIKSPLLYGSRYIEENLNEYNVFLQNKVKTYKSNQEELNQIFSNIYGLNHEVEVILDDKELSIFECTKSEIIKEFISYLVGVSFGRYSLDTDGLSYSKNYDNYKDTVGNIAKQIGAVMVFQRIGMNNGLDSNVLNLIKDIYGVKSYQENIDYIANALNKKNDETSEETICGYLSHEFFFDHLRSYQKRPIYWLLSSGKNEAFKCLLYVHKYNEDTLAYVNSQFLLPESARIKNEINEIESLLNYVDVETKRSLEKDRVVLLTKYDEIIEYGQVLDHMANRYISIDLDDGVKVNYEKFQGIEIVTDSGTRIKKDLLVPIK